MRIHLQIAPRLHLCPAQSVRIATSPGSFSGAEQVFVAILGIGARPHASGGYACSGE